MRVVADDDLARLAPPVAVEQRDVPRERMAEADALRACIETTEEKNGEVDSGLGRERSEPGRSSG